MKTLEKNEKFFLNISKAFSIDDKTITNYNRIWKLLRYFDKHNLTTFEFSFKVKNNKISEGIRFLNMDPDCYSCKNRRFFLLRLRLFEKIMRKYCINKDKSRIFAALNEISDTPMDLYFGADIKNNDYVFAFWLIFGGVKRDGKVNFWKYDFNKLINTTLESAGLKKNENLKENILNLGFDIGQNFLRYKVYYLCKEKIMRNSIFEELTKDINIKLKEFKYFYFWSEMYDEKGQLIKEKLFIEFLEDLFNSEKEAIFKLLINISKIDKVQFDLTDIQDKLVNCGGRISLISFEKDGTITFYVRPE